MWDTLTMIWSRHKRLSNKSRIVGEITTAIVAVIAAIVAFFLSPQWDDNVIFFPQLNDNPRVIPIIIYIAGIVLFVGYKKIFKSRYVFLVELFQDILLGIFWGAVIRWLLLG